MINDKRTTTNIGVACYIKRKYLDTKFSSKNEKKYEQFLKKKKKS